MVEYPHVDDREHILQSLGDAYVGLGWFCDTRGVVVVHQDRGGVIAEGLLHDDTRMDGCSIDGAEKEVLDRDNAMPVIEEDATKDLVRLFTDLETQEITSVISLLFLKS